ncbi:hypothetical protein [Nocardia sp. NPDC005825]|uniref:hypothetical protein n=1 Tax=unclassified Nocardia TaxID=2637762 RepID=UPI0033D88984
MKLRVQYDYPLAVIKHVLEERFSTASGDWICYLGVAMEMAVLAEVSHHTLGEADRQRLRRQWESLLTA